MTAAVLHDRGASSARPAGRCAGRPVARWMVYGFCSLTGPWRQIVRAESAAGALVKYSAEHDMPLEACHVQPA
jgi:hypothetical protein